MSTSTFGQPTGGRCLETGPAFLCGQHLEAGHEPHSGKVPLPRRLRGQGSARAGVSGIPLLAQSESLRSEGCRTKCHDKKLSLTLGNARRQGTVQLSTLPKANKAQYSVCTISKDIKQLLHTFEGDGIGLAPAKETARKSGRRRERSTNQLRLRTIIGIFKGGKPREYRIHINTIWNGVVVVVAAVVANYCLGMRMFFCLGDDMELLEI